MQQARDSEAVTQELQSNMRLASQLGINGTPVFVIGDEILTGAVGYDRLKEAIEQARAES